MVYICGRPVRPLTKAIWLPVLRFQVGAMSGPLALVRRREFPPDASTTKMLGYPFRVEENAILPSGDHDGEKFIPPNRAKPTMRLRSNEYIMISQPPFVTELNASREPSGEMRGDREMVPRCVIGCWLAPS